MPQNFNLYDSDGPSPPDEHIDYDRPFPIWGGKLINRGCALPLPIGVSIIGVHINLVDAPEICIPDPRPTRPGDPPRPPICSDKV